MSDSLKEASVRDVLGVLVKDSPNFGQPEFAVNPVFAAGSAAANTKPKFQSGTVLTTPEAGALEYDGNVFYLSNAASARGLVPSVFVARIDASQALVDDGSDQAVFPSANDALTVEAGATYLFDGLYSITKGANDVDTFMLFGGTATLTSIRYFAQGVTAATAGTAVAMLSQNITVATEIEVAANGTGVHVRILFQGCMEVNAAGTFIPMINFSAATGSTPAVNVDTYIRLMKLGSNPITAIGPWA